MSGQPVPAEWITITIQEEGGKLVFTLQKYSTEKPSIDVRRHPKPQGWPLGLHVVRLRFRAKWAPAAHPFGYRDMRFRTVNLMESLLSPARVRVFDGNTLIGQERITEEQLETCVRDIVVWALRSVQEDIFD